MEDQFQLLFENMKLEMQKQSTELKDSITNSIMDKMDERLQHIIVENKALKIKIEKLEKEIEYLKRDKKNNNIIIFEIGEEKNSTSELLQTVTKLFAKELNIKVAEYEVNNIYRIGKTRPDGKPRPILLSFVSMWKKNEIIKCRNNLKDVYIKEDYSKEVLEKRKLLQVQLAEERKKGNFAYIKYDKIIIKGNDITNDKRKRVMSVSPQHNKQTKKQQTTMPIKNSRLNAFDVMRGRSNSFFAYSEENKQ